MKNSIPFLAMIAFSVAFVVALLVLLPEVFVYVKDRKIAECRAKHGDRYGVMFIDGLAYCYDEEGANFHGTGYIPQM
jgi:hypothetical protein